MLLDFYDFISYLKVQFYAKYYLIVLMIIDLMIYIIIG